MAEDDDAESIGALVEHDFPLSPRSIRGDDTFSCDLCSNDAASIKMDWFDAGKPFEIKMQALCTGCAAHVLLQMPINAGLENHPLAIRLLNCPESGRHGAESSTPEMWRPLKRMKLTERLRDLMCCYCNKWQAAASMDMVSTSEPPMKTSGDFCFRCCAKFLLEVFAGKMVFNDNPTALAQIV